MQIAAPARCHTQQEGDELNVLEQEKSHAFPGKQARGSTGSPSCGGEQPARGDRAPSQSPPAQFHRSHCWELSSELQRL